MSNFSDIDFEKIFKPMSEEEIKKEKIMEEERKKYYDKVKENFLNLARSLPGREFETPSDPLTTIKGEIKDNKIVNLRALTSNRALKEGINMIFSNNDNNYFEYSINNNVTLKSDAIPENFKDIMSWILKVDGINYENDYNNGKSK